MRARLRQASSGSERQAAGNYSARRLKRGADVGSRTSTLQTSTRARYRRIMTIGLSAVHQMQVGLKRYAKRVERAAAIDRELSDGLGAGALYRHGMQGAARAILKFVKPLKARFKAPLLRLTAQR